MMDLRLALAYLGIVLLGTYGLYHLFLEWEIAFNPIPLLMIVVITAFFFALNFVNQHLGPLFYLGLSEKLDFNLGLFTRHHRVSKVKDLTLIQTHAGPRLLLRYVMDPAHIDKAKQDPNRWAEALQTLFNFESVAIFFKKIEPPQGGYKIQEGTWAGDLMKEINRNLPKNRPYLVADLAIAIAEGTLENLSALGLPIGSLHGEGERYNSFIPITPSEYAGALPLDHGAAVVLKEGFFPALRFGDGCIKTFFEISEAFLIEPDPKDLIAAVDRLEFQLGRRLQLFFHTYIPLESDFKKMIGLAALQELVGTSLTQADHRFKQLNTALKDYKAQKAGPNRGKPRLFRGALLIEGQVSIQGLESINELMRKYLGFYMSPLSGAHQLRMCLSLIPGWEMAAHALGQHGNGHHAAPADLCRLLSRIQSSWPGDTHHAPYLILQTEDGKSFPWSPWATTAFNALIVGDTGSGKSFLCNMILLAHLAGAPRSRTIVFDYGQSYLMLAKILGARIVDHDVLNPETKKPYRFAPVAFLGAHFQTLPEEDLQRALQQAVTLTKDLWLNTLNLSNCTAPGRDTGLTNLFDFYFSSMLTEAIRAFSFEGIPFGQVLTGCFAFIEQEGEKARSDKRHEEIARALKVLVTIVHAMKDLRRSYLSPEAKGLNFTQEGSFVYFNLDGYPEHEVQELVATILLNLAQLTLTKTAVPSLILMDEVDKLAGVMPQHHLQKQNPLLTFIEKNLVVARKYGIAMILSSQYWHHFTQAIMAATQTHIAMIQTMKNTPPDWKIKNPIICTTSMQAQKAQAVGYSTVCLGKFAQGGHVEIAGRFYAPNVFRELFESAHALKNLRATVAEEVNLPPERLVFLAQDQKHPYRSIGSPEWYQALIEHPDLSTQRTFLVEAKQRLTLEGFANGRAQAFLTDWRRDHAR